MEDGASILQGAGVHQFCRLGRLAYLAAASMTTKDIPPFIFQRGINDVAGISTRRLRRGGLDDAGIATVRRLFSIFYRSRLTIPNALDALEEQLGSSDLVREFVTFVRASSRGINRAESRGFAA